MSEVVTVLTPEMVCIGPLRINAQCGCLVHWRRADRGFGMENFCEVDILCRMIGRAATGPREERDKQFAASLRQRLNIKRKLSAKACLAIARNRATAIMGYVVNNPEAKWGEAHRHEYADILREYHVSPFKE